MTMQSSFRIIGAGLGILFAGLLLSTLLIAKSSSEEKMRVIKHMTNQENSHTAGHLETATLATGCFWCSEAIFGELKGVEKVTPGYSGGSTPSPTYEQVCTGATGYAESVQIQFNPKVISYADLLRIFFTVHDPTTLNRQGADVGTQYRSAIFYHGEEQKAIAQKVLKEIETEHLWKNPIVTEITSFKSFYPAEAYHDHYFERNPQQPYCQMVIEPKVLKFREKFKSLLKGSEKKDTGMIDPASSNSDKIVLTEDQWRQKLAPEQYAVLRQRGTERPFTGKYDKQFEPGIYVCAGCGQELFQSDTKFDAGCGWPSFYKSINKENIIEREDDSHGMRRIEVICKKCGGHLGHVFPDGPEPTGLRYCINSASLGFIRKEK
jgi:peptide methionine sulfoxide reductase msrA/msrB